MMFCSPHDFSVFAIVNEIGYTIFFVVVELPVTVIASGIGLWCVWSVINRVVSWIAPERK